MGLSDWFKKLFEPPNFVSKEEPHCLRHYVLTLRLPAGWQFTVPSSDQFTATGPGGCSASCVFGRVWTSGTQDNPSYMSAKEMRGRRPEFIKLLQNWFKGGGAVEVKSADNILWLERSKADAQSALLEMAIVNYAPRDPVLDPPWVLRIDCTAPAGAGGGTFVADRFDALRTALQSAEWN